MHEPNLLNLLVCTFALTLLLAGPAAAQTGTITGTITDDESGDPLPGVNVLVVGTQSGAATGADGTYEITGVKPGTYTIRASFIGYGDETAEGVEVQSGETTVADIAMQQQAQGLDEVVVVGYGTEQAENLTGSVSSVQVDEVEGRPITDMSQALSGLAAGVNVTKGSGKPGADGARIRIRGVGTLGNSDPLVIVDGIPSSLSGLNPSDIESISVLKDAASAAIYGSRAANGVILVTTKQGRGGELQVQYDGYAGLQQPTRLMDMVFDMPTHMRLLNESKTNLGLSPQFPQEEIEAYESNSDPILYPNTNWYDWAFQNPTPVTSHTLSVRGGLEPLSYYLSGGYLGQDGLIGVTSKDRYNLRLNTEANLSSRFTVGTNLYGYWQEVQGDYNTMSLFLDAATTPGVVPYHDGRYGGAQARGEGFVGNPKAWLDSRDNSSTRRFFLGKAYAEWSILENLTAEVNGAIEIDDERSKNLNLPVTLYNLRTDEVARGQKDNITLNELDVLDRQLTFYSTLNYEERLGDHRLKVLGGTEAQSFRSESIGTSVEQIYSPNTPVLDAGSANPTSSGSVSEWALLSYFGRVQYNYSERYLLELNARYDGSSRFREGLRWGFFPSVSAGWRVSEEPFFPETNLVSNLKLRGSLGTLGNQQIGTYPYQSLYQLGLYYNFGGQLVQGAAQTALANQDIRWETTRTANVGIDLGLLEGRLNLTAEYFDKRTSDILVRVPVPDYLGNRTAPYQNIGRMRNTGWEASLSYNGSYEGFTFGAGANLTHVSNEVTQYKGETPAINGSFIIKEGLPYQSIYGYKVEGLFQSEEEVANAAEQGPLTAPGDLQYADLNGDGVISPDDRTVIGNTIPELNYGFNVDLGYKGVQLSALFQGLAGVDRYLEGKNVFPFVNGDRALAAEFWLDRWTPENRDTDVPRLTNPASYDWNYRNSEYWMQDGAYLRLKSLRLGYRLPPSWTQSLGIDHLQIYALGENLFTHTDFLGYDPERAPTDSGMGYPNVRTYTLGLQTRL